MQAEVTALKSDTGVSVCPPFALQATGCLVDLLDFSGRTQRGTATRKTTPSSGLRFVGPSMCVSRQLIGLLMDLDLWACGVSPGSEVTAVCVHATGRAQLH